MTLGFLIFTVILSVKGYMTGAAICLVLSLLCFVNWLGSGLVWWVRPSRQSFYWSKEKPAKVKPIKPRLTIKRTLWVIVCIVGCLLSLTICLFIALVNNQPLLLLLWIPVVILWCLVGKRRKSENEPTGATEK